MPESLLNKAEGHETWFKQKRVFIPNAPERQSQLAKGASQLYSSMQFYRKLLNQSRLGQIQEWLTRHCAIALQPQPAYPSSSNLEDCSNQIEQLKDNFLSTISHELRTPIASIKMAAQMLTLALSREGLLSPVGRNSLNGNKIAHYLKILNDECNREISLITDLLDLQQLEAAAHPINLQPIVLEPYLQRIIRPFQEQAQSRQLTLATDIPSQLPVLMSDAQSLERVLVELLTNACRFTPALETIHISLQIKTADHSGEQICLLQVCNSGVELPPEQLSRIFDTFYRIPSSDPHQHPGTGLGLSLVRKLVAHLGGTIRVTSTAQETCFSVELPVNPAVSSSALASVSAPAG
jgi:signal transduction histidine kinase